MSKIVEFAQVIEAEINQVQDIANHALREACETTERNKEFKRRLIELLNEFYPDY